jgi:D-glycero-alpha-D-manno-heptose-7-phosphate kinase
MIGTRTPFRISFAGGGSDLRSFYSRQPGCVVSTSINKYMYILVHPYFDRKIQVKYSRVELVDHAAQIQHPIVRIALGRFGIEGVDINSIADIPAGTGLGSSCSFTVGLLNALYAYAGKFASKEVLAQDACEIEIENLGEPIGKQDIYAAAYGGLNMITFYPDETVQVEPVIMPRGQRDKLTASLRMFFLGSTRSASDILGQQQSNVEADPKKFAALARMVELARQLREALVSGRVDDLGPILDENWQLKKTLSGRISNDRIDAYYEKAKRHGASGGKLLGAGGAGFLLLYCPPENHDRLRRALADLQELEFSFDSFGSQVIYYEESRVWQPAPLGPAAGKGQS